MTVLNFTPPGILQLYFISQVNAKKNFLTACFTPFPSLVFLMVKCLSILGGLYCHSYYGMKVKLMHVEHFGRSILSFLLWNESNVNACSQCIPSHIRNDDKLVVALATRIN